MCFFIKKFKCLLFLNFPIFKQFFNPIFRKLIFQFKNEKACSFENIATNRIVGNSLVLRQKKFDGYVIFILN